MNSKVLYWLGVLAWCGLCWWWYVFHIVADCSLQNISAVNSIVHESSLDLTSDENAGIETEPLEPETYESGNIDDVQVEFEEDRVTIHYPYNSAQREVNKKVDVYLKDLSTKLITSGKKIMVTGYTDNVGTPKNNMKVSQQRARNIQNILLNLGVPKQQIKVDWYGERNPASTNTTAEGRYQNRRVEIRFLEI